MTDRVLTFVSRSREERWIVKNASMAGPGKWRITLQLGEDGERRIFTAPNNPRNEQTKKRMYDIGGVLGCIPEGWEENKPGVAAGIAPLAETVAKLPAPKAEETAAPHATTPAAHAESEDLDLGFDLVELLPAGTAKTAEQRDASKTNAEEARRVEKSKTLDEVDELLQGVFQDGEKNPAPEKSPKKREQVTFRELKGNNLDFLMYRGMDGSLCEAEFEKVVKYTFDFDEHRRAFELITRNKGKLDSSTNNVAAQIIGALGEEGAVEKIIASGLDAGAWFAKEARAIKAATGT